MPYTQPVESPPLRDDLFPAQVYIPGPTVTHMRTVPDVPTSPGANNYVPEGFELLHRPARVLLSATHLWIFIDGSDGPDLHTHGALADLDGDRRHGFRIEIEPTAANPDPEHPLLVVTRYANCGCGSRLRSFRPFPQMRLIA